MIGVKQTGGNGGGSSMMQNNFQRKLNVSYENFAGISVVTQVLKALNQEGFFENINLVIDETETYTIVAHPLYRPQVIGWIPPVYKYQLINLGKNLPGEHYGFEGIPFTADNLELVYASSASASDIIDENTKFENISTLGGLTIDQYVNVAVPSYYLQDRNIGTVIFNVGEEPNITQYWFLGAGGTYGLDQGQTVPENFAELGGDSMPGIQYGDPISFLENDLDYQTEEEVNALIDLKLPTLTSELGNDGEDGTSPYATEQDVETSILQIQQLFDWYIPVAQKNEVNGVAPLGQTAKLLPENIPFGNSANTVMQGNDARVIEAFAKKVNAISVTGDSNKTITLTREDGTVLTATFLDKDTEYPDDVINTLTFNANNDGVLIAITSQGEIISVSLDGRYSLLGHTHPISIRNGSGVEQFTITDFLRFENVSFNAATKTISADGLVPLSVFLDPINGNDATGSIENAKKPFKTFKALHEALPPDSGQTFNIYITGGNIPITRKVEVRNFNWIAYTNSTLDFTNCMEADGVTHANRCLDDKYNGAKAIWNFNNSNISIINNHVGFKNFRASIASATPINLRGNIDILNWKPQYALNQGYIGSFGIGDGSEIVFNTVYESPQDTAIFGFGGVPSTIRIKNLVVQYGRRLSDSVINNKYTIDKITQSGTTSINHLNGLVAPTDDVSIGDVTFTVAGKLKTTANVLNFFGKLNANVTVELERTKIITGILDSETYCGNQYSRADQEFRNFKGKLNDLRMYSDNTKFIFTNSDVTVLNSLVNNYNSLNDSKESIIFNGFNVINQIDTTKYLFNNTVNGNTPSIINIVDNGTTNTNAKTFGLRTTYKKNNATFKEKKNELVIRSKIDLVNKVLDSQMNYIIDGVLADFLPTESIIVPLGGLSISGYGFDVSSLKTLQPNSTLFTSPVGGCGNVFMSNISLEASGGGSKVFSLTNAGAPTGGADAIELNVVNFDNCDSLGELTNFRQGLWDNIGVFGVKDGLTLTGVWSGGFRSDLTIVRNFGVAGTASTLFKAGAGLLFKSRFWTDINADFKAAGMLSNFTEENFFTPKLYQIKGAQITRSNILDDTQNYTGTINNRSIASDWAGNNGIENSYENPYGIKTGRLQICADDAAAQATGLVEIRDVYIEASTGYLKARLV